MLSWHALRNPYLFGTPVLSEAVGLVDCFVREPRTWSRDLQVAGLFLSLDPPIFCAQPQPRPFGAASYLAARFPETPFVFLHAVTHSLERPTFALSVAQHYRRFRKAHRRARLIVMANTPGEEELLRRFGVDVYLAPQNMFVDETMFHPIVDRPRTYDAIYNAQLVPIKRHELARLVPSCAYVTKLFGRWSPHLKKAQLHKFVHGLPRGHVIINEIEADNVVFMDHVQVNEAMASAHVGLCLSKLEGAMYASIEYLLAGLPVVSTRSKGGRDTFFHPDTTLIVDDNPRAVQEGVAAMKARAIPADFTRSTTLRLMAIERERFNTFIDGLRGNQVARTDQRWSFNYCPKLAQLRKISDFEAQLSQKFTV
ncbi:glycosyltransferase involved in cell wall biosynthesis [Methylobacterium sp. PvP062]|jgi:glycosyltransferase involved in cell wall biosynthesis|uniref:Glycosyltransferase involved in cell wall biosynthesis n=1 Tax=Methylobacterium radiotolerans TaxID=31998 RepID=A0ABV2NCC5_9HYPH|nr:MULTISPECIES: glycosyltransferase [unclassified Methylobacterium]AYO83198.1 glycosyltransferase family 1 protein [Methylobacterium brachiatum]MBP2492626.1 glycosyltransferase involved in cell wall biosynthesis [Methylobacterium sp. PvP105]MBP2501002.1 glycosyltransferase involved in cell wall biosynthesis [Methylobacterium sp. PvP109]MCX7333555.1 glycosyltransferase [Hyphomicrobiales bacterium]